MGTINRRAFRRTVDEDIEWLKKQPSTLESRHIELILRGCVEMYYPPEGGVSNDRSVCSECGTRWESEKHWGAGCSKCSPMDRPSERSVDLFDAGTEVAQPPRPATPGRESNERSARFQREERRHIAKDLLKAQEQIWDDSSRDLHPNEMLAIVLGTSIATCHHDYAPHKLNELIERAICHLCDKPVPDDSPPEEETAGKIFCSWECFESWSEE